MKQTPLHKEHQKLNAKMKPFASFTMPLSYAGVKDEYWSVRKDLGLFDISHMAPILIRAENTDDIIQYLNYITCRDLANLHGSQVQYNALVNEQGGVVDDITIYVLDPLVFMLIVNAANSEAVLKHLRRYQSELDSPCTIHLLSEYILLAIQGPSSEKILRSVQSIDCETGGLYHYECTKIDVKDTKHANKEEIPKVISRTGYTGEDGFEVLLEKNLGLSLWKELIDLGVQPCGLASRDLLRMEVFYPLYGQELSSEKTPAESGIAWLISPSKEFLGKAEVLSAKEKPVKETKGFRLFEEGVARRGHEIFTKDEKKIGIVTSGSYSFQWEKGFGIAYLDVGYANTESELFLQIRGQNKKIMILNKSPYQGSICKRPQ